MSTTQTQNNDEFLLGIMVLKDGKWKPHSKFNNDQFGSALIKAEEVDSGPEYDAVKVMRIPVKGASGSGQSEENEMWISPHLAARSKARAQNKVAAGMKQSRNNIAADYAARKAKAKSG